MRILAYSKILYFLFFTIILSHSKDPVRSENGMVVSASELASQVGIEILKSGGNAVDAAVATGFALAVTYPSAGNIGGGGFMVIRLADGTETTIDYREMAPVAAERKMFLDECGNYDPDVAQKGMTSSGVPGSVAGLIYALEKYGTLSIREVIAPAIKLADEGFELSYRLAESFNSLEPKIQDYPSTLKIFHKENAFQQGDVFIQKDLAKTLALIAKNGLKGFYEGETAELIVKQSEEMGGIISFDDLKNYKPIERLPVKGTYKGYDIISMAPPSSGGVAIIEALNVLEYFPDFDKSFWNSSGYIHNLSEILKYVYADRSIHLGDPDYYNVPVDSLTNKSYAATIFDKITNIARPASDFPGLKNNFSESEETTHYSVIDKDGNMVSTTTTINSSYGNKIVVEGAGFLMNNEMDDFSSKPGHPNQFGLIGGEANSIEPGKRMLSSMTPTIILKEGNPYMIIGSPGGSTIITVVLQVILNCIDFNMDIQQAIDAPRIHHQWLPDRIDYEEFGLTEDVRINLVKRGHTLGKIRVLGRAEGILIDENNIRWGATDPRGYGGAVGY